MGSGAYALFFTKPKKGLFETAMAFSIPQLDGLAFAGLIPWEEQKNTHTSNKEWRRS